MARPEQVYHKREIEHQLGFAQAVKAGDTLYITGLVSWDNAANLLAAGDMKKQIENIYRELSEILAAHNAGLRQVVKETLFTTDMEALAENADTRAGFYRGDNVAPPASTWVQVSRLGDPGWLIEVDVIAFLD